MYLFGCTESQLWHAGSFVTACGNLVPQLGIKPRVSLLRARKSTGPPGKSLFLLLYLVIKLKNKRFLRRFLGFILKPVSNILVSKQQYQNAMSPSLLNGILVHLWLQGEEMEVGTSRHSVPPVYRGSHRHALSYTNRFPWIKYIPPKHSQFIHFCIPCRDYQNVWIF